MNPFLKKRFTKKDREEAVLMGLVEMYIKTSKPIGSNSLKEQGFEFISSATIRNYFNKFEKMGYLKQSHISGGRIPTTLAYRAYANISQENSHLLEKERLLILKSLKLEDQEIASYLQESIENLSELTSCSVFFTSPRFDQDFIHDIKLVRLDAKKTLCIIITHFGLIKTETLFIPKKLNDKELQQIQEFFLFKLGKAERPAFIDKSLSNLAQHFYNEVMVRHIVGYAHFFSDDIYKTGLSKLLNFPEFSDPVILAKNLAIFEDPHRIESLLAECMKINRQTCWIGEELAAFSKEATESCVIAIPYHINHRVVGAIAVLGPARIDYPKIFAILKTFSQALSEELTRSLYKFKITFRQSAKDSAFLKSAPSILLENKSY